ncbi:MAG: hypothetical protein CVV64_20065 [Candidatus Wallbacteria bacterium HGW-Wallbacteria-1]|jgi:hypothetical protein|uniref:Putative Flp pilus-assembly TadG-like N-terminal domain-containing protein n=1 Tax=Candidatus Wallbacteria bacterium HGW-Wallbacteria-1 TaxID=2013854 RepID=A0A2N1PIG6_9BACT|nr:MAG: hypothetical protein CVV64_20065 [Candidatus Wallbacteria bacterium HGW-Wallbacteria-1]
MSRTKNKNSIFSGFPLPLFLNSASGLQAGQVLIITAISMVTLMGFTGLAIDAGYVYFHKARLQGAADAAALAIVNEYCLKAYSSIDGKPDSTSDPTFMGTVNAREIAERYVSMTEVDVAVEVSEQKNPRAIIVTCRKNLKSFFSRVFGFSVWKVSVISAAATAPACSIGFEDCPYETGGMRPVALVMPSKGLNPGDELTINIGPMGSVGNNAFLVTPQATANFQIIGRALDYGFQGKIDSGTPLFPITGFESSVISSLVNSTGKSMVLPVVGNSDAAPSVRGMGFVRLSLLGGKGNSLNARIEGILKPRPILVY